MSGTISDINFKVMSLMFKIRDFFSPRKDILAEVGIKPGFHVLDYGCGPGSYITATAEMVGESGKIYALDIHPLAIKRVQKIASSKQLANVETIISDCKTGLPENSIDVVFLYDILHDLDNADGVLGEISRVLKPEGILSVSDHHLNEDQMTSRVTNGGLFKLLRKGEKTFSFTKDH